MHLVMRAVYMYIKNSLRVIGSLICVHSFYNLLRSLFYILVVIGYIFNCSLYLVIKLLPLFSLCGGSEELQIGNSFELGTIIRVLIFYYISELPPTVHNLVFTIQYIQTHKDFINSHENTLRFLFDHNTPLILVNSTSNYIFKKTQNKNLQICSWPPFKRQNIVI